MFVWLQTDINSNGKLTNTGYYLQNVIGRDKELSRNTVLSVRRAIFTHEMEHVGRLTYLPLPHNKTNPPSVT